MSSKILVGVVLSSGVFMALGDVVLDRTANIVGYADVELRPGLNLLASPFQSIGSTNGTIDIQSAIRSSGLIGMDWNTDEVGDGILMWDPLTGVYDFTSHWAGATDTTPYLGYDVSNTWIDPESLTPSEIDLSLGRAFWLTVNAPSNILATFAGEVARGDAHAVPVLAGGDMLGAPHPQEIDIQEVRADDFPGFDASYAFQTTLRALTGSGYANYGWCAQGQGSAEGVPEFDARWLLDDFGDVAARTFDVGEGFWVFSPTNGAVVFQNPGEWASDGPGALFHFTECTRQTNGVLLRIACPGNTWWYSSSAKFDIFCKERLPDSKWFFVGYADKPSYSSMAQGLIPGEVLPVWFVELPIGSGIQPHVVTNFVLGNCRSDNINDLHHQLAPLPGLVQTNLMHVAEGARTIPERYFFIAVRSFTDSDGDGLFDDLEILQAGSDPENIDSDGDGMADGWEFDYGLDSMDSSGAHGPHGDPDGDGLTNFEEYRRAPSTVPVMADSDGDGLPDGWEAMHSLTPTHAGDASLDSDGDGLTNLEEYQHGTDPSNQDADGDSISDGIECLLDMNPNLPCQQDLDDSLRFEIRTPMP